MPPPKLTKLELQIMELLWGKGPSSIREIQEAFPQRGKGAPPPAYTTVQTIVYRLEWKKAVRRAKPLPKPALPGSVPGMSHDPDDRDSGGGNRRGALIGLAIGTLIVGALQLTVQLPPLKGLGYRFHPDLSWRDPGVVAILTLMGPAVIAASTTQINVLINSMFASTLGDGAIFWLAIAFRSVPGSYLPKPPQ